MISLYLDIYYFSQLKRIDSQTIDVLLSRVNQTVQNANGRSHCRHSPFVFTFDDSIPGIKLQAAQASFAVYNELKSSGEKLSGFVLALDDTQEENPDMIERSFKSMVFPLQADNNFLVGEELADDFSEYFSYESRGDFRVVLDFRFTHPVSADESQGFWERPSQMRSMMDLLDPYFSGERSGGIVLFRGDRSEAPMRNLERALKPLTGPVPVPLFRYKPLTSNPYSGMCTSIQPSDIPVAASRLSKTERRAFESARAAYEYIMKTPFKKHIPGEIDRRFRLFMDLYMKGFVRDRLARGLPPLILMEDMDLHSPKCLSIISEIMERNQEGMRPIVLGTLQARDWTGLDPSRFVLHELPEPNRKDIEDYLAKVHDRSLPESDEAERAEFESILADWAREPLHFYHAFLSGKNSKNPTKKYLSGLPDELLEILYVAIIANGILDRQNLEAYLSHSGRKPQSQQLAFRQLYQMGLILSPDCADPCALDLDTAVGSILGEKASNIRLDFFSYLASLAAGGALFESIELYQFASAAGLRADPRAIARCLSREYALDNADSMKTVRQAGFFKGIHQMDVKDRLCLDRWAGFLSAFARGEDIGGGVDAMDSAAGDEECALAGQRCMAHFYHDYASARSRESLSWAKRALILFQKSKDVLGEAQANRALGLCFLRGEQIYDAMDYFSNAFSIAESVSDDFDCVLDSYYEGLSYFFHGNYSRASRLAQKSRELAQKCFRPDWEIQAIFLAMRVEFELGRFESALDLIGQARSTDRLSSSGDCGERLEIWAGRCLSRMSEFAHAREIFDRYPDDPESMAFLAETLIETDEPEAALAIVERALEKGPREKGASPEKPSFASGYQLLEDRAIGGSGKEDAFGLFLLSTRAEIKRRLGKQEEASGELYQLTRELKLSECDPNLHVYLYLYFLSIPESGGMSRDLSGFQTDRATILSKAFKYLQLRASRIDTAGDKNSFMTANRVNRMLLDSAKLYKFI
jgi:tetratricopeptide (TPR) repeat protein